MTKFVNVRYSFAPSHNVIHRLTMRHNVVSQ